MSDPKKDQTRLASWKTDTPAPAKRRARSESGMSGFVPPVIQRKTKRR